MYKFHKDLSYCGMGLSLKIGNWKLSNHYEYPDYICPSLMNEESYNTLIDNKKWSKLLSNDQNYRWCRSLLIFQYLMWAHLVSNRSTDVNCILGIYQTAIVTLIQTERSGILMSACTEECTLHVGMFTRMAKSISLLDTNIPWSLILWKR